MLYASAFRMKKLSLNKFVLKKIGIFVAYRRVRSKYPPHLHFFSSQPGGGVFMASEQKSSVVSEFWKIIKFTFRNRPLTRGGGYLEWTQRYVFMCFFEFNPFLPLPHSLIPEAIDWWIKFMKIHREKNTEDFWFFIVLIGRVGGGWILNSSTENLKKLEVFVRNCTIRGWETCNIIRKLNYSNTY